MLKKLTIVFVLMPRLWSVSHKHGFVTPADFVTARFGSRGLGLAIARAIVEGHDGEIDVQDRDDAPSGARFTIRLPAADRA